MASLAARRGGGPAALLTRRRAARRRAAPSGALGGVDVVQHVLEERPPLRGELGGSAAARAQAGATGEVSMDQLNGLLRGGERCAPEAADVATRLLLAAAAERQPAGGAQGGEGAPAGAALPSAGACKRVLYTLSRSTKRKRALQALALLDACGRAGVRVGPAAARGVVVLAARAGEPHRADTLLHALRARGTRLNAATYTAVMGGFSGDEEHSARALALFRQMRQVDGIAADAQAMNAAVTALVTQGDVPGAEALVERVGREDGVAPNVTTHNVLLWGHSRAGDLTATLDRAREVLLPADLSKPRPTLGTYVSLSHAYARAGDSRRAARLLGMSAMRAGLQPTVASWTAAAQGAAGAGQVVATRHMLDAMQRAGATPTGKTYAALAGALARAGRVEAALDMCTTAAARARDGMLVGGGRAAQPAFIELARALCASGRFDEAQALRPKLEGACGEASPPHRFFSALLHGARRTGDATALLQVSSEMRAAGFELDAADSTVMMLGLAEAGRLESALALFRRAGRVDASMHRARLAILARGGLSAQAEGAMRDMAAAGFVLDLRAYGALVDAHCTANDVEAAIDVLARARAAGVQPDERMFGALVDACARSSRFSTAMGLIEEMEAQRLPVEALRESCREVLSERARRAADIERDNLREGVSDSPLWTERFKFWLGLPNDLYAQDEWSKRSDGGNRGARNLLLEPGAGMGIASRQASIEPQPVRVSRAART